MSARSSTLLAAALWCSSAGAKEDAIRWQPWSDAAFAQARSEKRLVLLDLEAVWCHWCHVMDRTTYRDPRVVKLIAEHYVALRVDQDARPDLSLRYEEWGWPATVVLSAEGSDLVRRRGYQEPAELARLLSELARDPRPRREEPAAPSLPAQAGPRLTEAQRALLAARFREGYDPRWGGWGTVHKFVNGGPIEYALALAAAGDRDADAMARTTLDAALALSDPEWGGVYQYSTSLDWKTPHFEKILAIQAEAILTWSLGASLWQAPRLLAAARATARYLADFLTDPGGGLYPSQDADLSEEIDGHRYYALPGAERRKLGLPRVDHAIYARDSGWAIAALAQLADASGDPQPLAQARRAAGWIIAHRSLGGAGSGGFRHGDDERPYLGDTLAMGEACLRLHASTGEREWLERAVAAADFIARSFAVPGGDGFLAAPGGVKSVDENIALARFANLLSHYSGRREHRELAERAMRHLVRVAESRRLLPGVLQAERELESAPLHVTVVGRKADPKAAALFAAARRTPVGYRRTEWWDRREGPLPHADVEYPELPEAAAFACSGNACSLPVTDPLKLSAVVARLRDARR